MQLGGINANLGEISFPESSSAIKNRHNSFNGEKNYVVIGRGLENPDILQWSKDFLAQSKWNPGKITNDFYAPYSWISGHPVTLLFAGISNNQYVVEQLNNENLVIFHLVEETLRKLVVQYEVPAIDLRVHDIVCLGDSRNCLAVQLSSPGHQLVTFHADLIKEMNKLEIFDPIVDRYSFSIHTTIAYKRMDPITFNAFIKELINLLNNNKPLQERELILNVIDYVTNSPLSQITRNIKKLLLKLGFPSDKLNRFQESLAISAEELKEIKKNFSLLKNKALNIQSVQFVERPELTAFSGFREKSLYTVQLYYLYPSVPNPFLKKLFKLFPIRLEHTAKSMLFLAGARARGTTLPTSDWDIFVFLQGPIDIEYIRKTIHQVALDIFSKDTQCKSVKVRDNRHSLGLNLFDGINNTSIDLVPITSRFISMNSPFRIFDSQLNLWKPCNPRKARIDLERHPHSMEILYLIQLIKMWNKKTGSRLRSFHIERLLIRMPCEDIPDYTTALGLAFDFIAHHFQVPLIYDNAETCINRGVVLNSDKQSEGKHYLSVSEINTLKEDLLYISGLFRALASGNTTALKYLLNIFFDKQVSMISPYPKISMKRPEPKAITQLYRYIQQFELSQNEIFKAKRFTNRLLKAHKRSQKIVDQY